MKLHIFDFLAKPIGYRLWQFKNLSEIGMSRYFLQALGLRFILGYDENRIFLTFWKSKSQNNLSEIGRSRYFLQALGLRFTLGYDENRIFLTFWKSIGFGNVRFFGIFLLL